MLNVELVLGPLQQLVEGLLDAADAAVELDMNLVQVADAGEVDVLYAIAKLVLDCLLT